MYKKGHEAESCSWGQRFLATAAVGTCCVPWDTCPAPGSHQPPFPGGMCDTCGRASCRSAPAAKLWIPWSRTQQTQVQPSSPASRGVPGQAEGFCTLELALRHSGGRKTHGGRCSDSAASSVSGGELFASLAARSAHAISGRA